MTSPSLSTFPDPVHSSGSKTVLTVYVWSSLRSRLQQCLLHLSSCSMPQRLVSHLSFPFVISHICPCFSLPLPLLLTSQMHYAFRDYVDHKLLGTGPRFIIFGVDSNPGFRALHRDAAHQNPLAFSWKAACCFRCCLCQQAFRLEWVACLCHSNLHTVLSLLSW